MKMTLILLATLSLCARAFSADALTEKLQRGLFEEEANHNLDAAIKEYQSVVAQSDEQRKVTATALFRLGECYRKLGRTNEAHAQYQRILRDYSEQEPLVKLSRDLLPQPPQVAGVSGSARPVSELEREEGRLTRALADAGSRLDTLHKLKDEKAFAAAAQLSDNKGLGTLQEQLRATEQKLVTTKESGLAAEHPEVRMLTALRETILQQLDGALQQVIFGEKNRSALLLTQLQSIRAELQRAREAELRNPSTSTSGSLAPPRLNPESERLLREEIRIAEQVAQSAEKNNAAGRALLSDALDARKEVLRLKRQLPENFSPAQQRTLLEEQIGLVKQHLSAVEKLAPDRLAPGQLLSIQRELLSLQRELATVRDVAQSSETTPTPALTQVEADALATAKSLVQNSPDLLNASPRANEMTPLQSAVSKGHHYVATFLLSNGADPNAGPGSPSIVLAAKNGNLRLVEMLLDKGADVNRASGEGKTALMAASEQGFKNLAEVLVARGAGVNHQTYNQETALHFAAFKGHASLVELLLKRGARTDVLSKSIPGSGIPGLGSDGGTPLHYAAHWGHSNIAELLLAAGAPVDATNRTGNTPLHLAATSGNTNVCALLLDRGAKIHATTEEGGTPLALAVVNNRAETVALLVARGADVNQPAFRSRPDAPNPFFLAVWHNNISALKSVLTAKPKLEAINRDNFTPLQVAVSANLEEAAELLLEAGAEPNRFFWDDNSLLHNAVSRGQVPLVKTLLKRGANPNVVNRQGETPLSLALGALRRLTPTRSEAHSFRRQLNPPGAVIGGVLASANPGAPLSYQWNSANPGGTPNPTVADYEQIVALLKSHGADEFLQRRGFISAVRGPSQQVPIFSKGTNDWNRYTLLEFLTLVYENSGRDFPFPDFAKITIYRLEAQTEKPILVNVAALMAATNCAGDVPLAWGDNVEIPMADHPVTAEWYGVAAPTYGQPDPQSATLLKCSQRTVQFSAGGGSVALSLAPWILDTRTGHGPKARQALFRLAAVVLRDTRFRNLLRSSSDLSRVRVTRTDPETKDTKTMTFDLNAVALPDMAYAAGNVPPIPWQQDLLLRDGDVIEVPEKQ